jgi:hypothetical protein
MNRSMPTQPPSINAKSVTLVGSIVRTQWTENRVGGPFFVVGELNPNGWQFWDRDAWEIRWFAVEATPDRLELANELAESMRDQPTGEGRPGS